MGCLGDETIAAYVDGALDLDATMRIDKHIDGCQKCRAQLSAMAASPVMHSFVSDTEAPAAEVIEALARGGAGDPVPGLAIGRYIVEQIIGRGGMGVVVRARDPELDRAVAIKVVDPWTSATSGAWRVRLRDEARAMARLRHPNVVTVYDVGVVGNQLFVAMELVEGESLARHLERDRKDAVALCIAAGRGLCAAHAAGLAHGDVKPDNILVDRDGRALIGDFGLTRTIGEDANAVGLLGTPGYMAPELLRKRPADALSDQFALAVTVYEAVAGRRPWHAASIDELLQAIEQQRPQRPAAMSRAVWSVVARGLAADRDARFPSLAKFIVALERAHGAGPRRRRIAIITAASAVALAGGIFAAANYTSTSACNDPIERTRGLVVPRCESAACGALANDLAKRAMAWRKTHVGVCRATQDGRQSAALLDRRMHCLERRLDEHEALVHSNAQPFEMLDALQRLESPESCATLDRAEQAVPAGKAASVAEAERWVAAAHADFALGHYLAGRDKLASHFAAIQSLHHPPLIAQAANMLGRLQMQTGDLDGAEASFDVGLRAAGESGDDVATAELLLNRAYLVGDLRQQWPRAAELFRAAEVAIARAGRLPDLESRLLHERGLMAEDTGQFAEAHAQYEKALALRRKIGLPGDIAIALEQVCAAEGELGKLADARAHCDEALQLVRESFGELHPLVAEAETNLAKVLAISGDVTAARKHWESALATLERGYGGDAPALAAVLINLATVAGDHGDPAGAERYLARALKSTANAVTSAEGIHARVLVANQLRATGRAREGVEMLEDVARRAEATLGVRDRATGFAFEELGSAYYEAERYRDAQDAWNKSLASAAAVYGESHQTTLLSAERVAEAKLAMNDAKSARPLLERVMLGFEAQLEPDSPLLATAYTDMADCLTRLGEMQRGLELAQKGLAIREQHGDDPLRTAEARYVLAQALSRAGRPGAVALARRARDELRALGPVAASSLAEVEHWLAKAR